MRLFAVPLMQYIIIVVFITVSYQLNTKTTSSMPFADYFRIKDD